MIFDQTTYYNKNSVEVCVVSAKNYYVRLDTLFKFLCNIFHTSICVTIYCACSCMSNMYDCV